MKLAQTRSFGSRLVRYFKDPGVPVWRKLVGFFAAVYVVMPVDAVPDVIPFVGWLDDVGLLGGAAWFVMREIKRHTERETSEPRPSRTEGSSRQAEATRYSGRAFRSDFKHR